MMMMLLLMMMLLMMMMICNWRCHQDAVPGRLQALHHCKRKAGSYNHVASSLIRSQARSATGAAIKTPSVRHCCPSRQVRADDMLTSTYVSSGRQKTARLVVAGPRCLMKTLEIPLRTISLFCARFRSQRGQGKATSVVMSIAAGQGPAAPM